MVLLDRILYLFVTIYRLLSIDISFNYTPLISQPSQFTAWIFLYSLWYVLLRFYHSYRDISPCLRWFCGINHSSTRRGTASNKIDREIWSETRNKVVVDFIVLQQHNTEYTNSSKARFSSMSDVRPYNCQMSTCTCTVDNWHKLV